MNRLGELFELLIALAFVVACHVTRNTASDFPLFDKEGHRGCRGLMPENTIPAMIRAVDLGVTTLEMDAVITKDKQVILSHEPFFNHEITTLPNGKYFDENRERQLNIYEMNYADTKQYDVGLKVNPRFTSQQKIHAVKPLLTDVIDDVEAYIKLKGHKEVFYNIETKTQPGTDNIYHPSPGEFVNILMNVINSKKIAHKVIIQSFDFRTLKIVHTKFPTIKTAALVDTSEKRTLKEQLDDLGFTPTIYSPAYSLVSPTLVQQCHQLGIKIIPWTVDDKGNIEKLKSYGVDGIITDYPDLLN